MKLWIEAPAGIQVWRDEIIEGSDIARVIYEEPSQGRILEGPSPVLLVEDNPDHAMLISRTLSEVCLTAPVIAETGEAALELLDRADEEPGHTLQPRLVLLDLRLPDMSGLDVLREIRARPGLKTMPVVILSAEQSDAVVTSCLEAGANAFVTKAADYDQFRNSIRRLAVFWGRRVPDSRACGNQPRKCTRSRPGEVSGFGVRGSGFRVQGSGFRVQGSGFRVQDSGFAAGRILRGSPEICLFVHLHALHRIHNDVSVRSFVADFHDARARLLEAGTCRVPQTGRRWAGCSRWLTATSAMPPA